MLADDPLPPPADSYAALAEFVAAYPDVSAALDSALLPIQPTSDAASQAKAAIALGSFVALCEYVADALDRSIPEEPAATAMLSLGQTPDYKFEWFDGTDDTQPAALATYVLVIENEGARPAGVGEPSIALPGYTTVQALGDETWLPPAYRPAVKAKTSFAYAFTAPAAPKGAGAEAAPQWLTAEVGRAIAGRTVQLSDLDLLERQDALTSIAVSRNAELVPDRPSRDAFVYGAPPVAFTDPLRPSIVDSNEFRIDKIGSKTPVVRTLTKQVRTLWTALFSGGPQQESIQCSVSYGYPLGPTGLPNVSLPVLMLPRTTFTTASEGEGGIVTQDDLTAAIAAQIQSWFTATQPAGGGTFTFDLQILAAADGMPLLGLSDLTLPLSSISPS